ncbi:NADPH-dependent FMN reductase [Streptomyces beihaiensis]|uniref:NAD(P)H-dependent oxidoreductase n=1 Tax=Streptomyces beihaiensis TaxID=2984495 RepID=A0ABT3TYM0_9ACTN|nr:NAD(P)H-dependent oxidoreductase [Streptomyces beihaiensis]MCX3062149.1 NAD(P)H-dependent oxidoreductase [Streptomyces beihaiensis]
MSPALLRLAVVLGSTREGRLCPVIASWFAGQARQIDAFEVDVVDPADLDVPVALSPQPPESVRTLGKRLEAADAFVIVTPEYNHSFPAPLKSLIDWHYVQWRAKPVGFVAYGGLAGGLRAVEQLRLVFAELHATTIRDTVSFHNAGDLFDDAGELREPAGATAAAKVMLEQLTWWADALQKARREHPYQQ